MAANSVFMDLQKKNILSAGDVVTLQGYASPRTQNQFLCSFLRAKCTNKAFKVACEVIIKADPTNTRMVELGQDMKTRLDSITGM